MQDVEIRSCSRYIMTSQGSTDHTITKEHFSGSQCPETIVVHFLRESVFLSNISEIMFFIRDLTRFGNYFNISVQILDRYLGVLSKYVPLKTSAKTPFFKKETFNSYWASFTKQQKSGRTVVSTQNLELINMDVSGGYDRISRLVSARVRKCFLAWTCVQHINLMENCRMIAFGSFRLFSCPTIEAH